MHIVDVYRDRNRVTESDLVEATVDELLELRVLVNEETARIDEQVNGAKAKAASTGVYSDADWYRRATSARRFKGQLIQRIQNELARKKRAQKESNRQRLTEGRLSSLLEAMDRVLKPEQKREVLDLWRDLKTAEQELAPE